MGIKRGTWNSEAINKKAAIKASRYGARPATLPGNGQSNSEQYMGERTPNLDDGQFNQNVSENRRENLIRATGQVSKDGNDPGPVLLHSNSFKSTQAIKQSFNKTAAFSSAGVGGSGSASFGGQGGTVRQAPEVYSPLFQIANLQLPRDRITMNAWNRNFYDTHPLVHNCINLHATYPIGKINIKCKDQRVQQFFQEMAEEIDIVNILQAIALEFWKMGEVFPYAELDESRGMWKNIIIQNPDYIHVKNAVLSGESVISMRPDAKLQALVHSNAPADVQLKKQIDKEILYHVKKGNNIPLDNFHVSHLKMLSSPYDTHGTSVIVSIYKDLMLYDKLRESKFAQADNLVNPITLVKVGGTAEAEYHPSKEDLENYRQVFEAAQYDKDFKIFTHAGVSVERVGAAGQIIDIGADITLILDNVLNGLMVPKAIITQEGASFNSASIGLEVLKQRYECFRNMITQWLTRKIFAPISEIQEFYEYKDGEKKLIVPEVEWNQMILYDMDNYIGVLNGLVGQQMVSKTTLYKSLGLNMDEEKRLQKEEMISAAIAQKEGLEIQKMSLGALRALKSDEEIIEQTEAPLPGAPGSQDAGIPGAGPMGGGMGAPPMGGGGMGPPPMGGPPGGGMGPPPGGPPPGGAPPGGDMGGGGAPPPPA